MKNLFFAAAGRLPGRWHEGKIQVHDQELHMAGSTSLHARSPETDE